MLQLNPYFNWSYDTDLFKKQFLLEPKFPLLKSLISKKKRYRGKSNFIYFNFKFIFVSFS